MADNADRGWICPVCGRGIAPGEKVCEHGRAVPWNPLTPYYPLPVLPTTPPYPSDWRGGCPACALSGVCNCYRPERDSPRMIAAHV